MVAFRAVLDFMAFAPAYTDLAEKLADAVPRHATPVGSGIGHAARHDPLNMAERAIEGRGFVMVANEGCFHFSSVASDRPEMKVFRLRLCSQSSQRVPRAKAFWLQPAFGPRGSGQELFHLPDWAW